MTAVYNSCMDNSEFEDVLPCAGKLAFDTKREAQATATTVEYQRGAKVRPYKCRYCQLWHLSSDYSDT